MDIHLPSDVMSSKHDARRQLPLRHLVPVPAEHFDEQRHSRASDDDVQVVVLARLLAEQGIDAPASVEPDLDVGAFERVHELHDVRGRHRCARVSLVVDGPFQVGVH